MDQRSKMNFKDIGFDDFRRMACDPNLNNFEKIGFPSFYREGQEPKIFQEILRHCPILTETKKTVIDIGPGCSDLPKLLMKLAEANGHELFLIDSEEMLTNLPNSNCRKIAGRFPNDVWHELQQLVNKTDVIICYSVLHYVFRDENLFNFLDRAVSLLKSKGIFFIGDIPNKSKRNRFFSSDVGIEFHKQFMNTNQSPDVHWNTLETSEIDDAIIFSILQRYRGAGCEVYIVPQATDLPMANRREDVLIIKN